MNDERTGMLSLARNTPPEKNAQRAAPAVTPSGRPQRTEASDEDSTVELSPFTIVAERETGWVANQTLAGSRMKTEFKDIAQPLEVMTKDFMDDLAVNNFEQALIYSTNVTGPQEYADNSNNNGIGFANQQPKNGNLMRGLAGATIFEDRSMPKRIKSPLTELKERGYVNPRRTLASIKRGLAESAAGKVRPWRGNAGFPTFNPPRGTQPITAEMVRRALGDFP